MSRSDSPGKGFADQRPQGTAGQARTPRSLEEWAEKPGATVVRELWRAIEARESPIFVTGPAGTGKSTLLNLVSKDLGGVPVVAPTGIAALRVSGQTIHSLFRIGKGVQRPEHDGTQRPEEVYRAMSTLILDEASMVRCDLLDAVDRILRRARSSKRPFGGVQLVMFGDPLQLPPVVPRDEWPLLAAAGYPSPHFFDAWATRRNTLRNFVLDQVHRQADRTFVDILNAIRCGRISPALLKEINKRVVRRTVVEGIGSLTLTTRRLDAEVRNERRLVALPLPEISYLGEVSGHFPSREFPTPHHLRLRRGARVMFVRNDPQSRWINGMAGTVVACEPDHVIVDRANGRGPCRVDPVEWEKPAFQSSEGKVERKIVGRYRQLPLNLGWAATVHRAQGLSLDRVHLDLGRGAFAAGQAYVGLSRSRTLSGLTLERPIRPADVIVDRRVLEFLATELGQRAA